MTKRTIAAYLEHESKTIGNLLTKFNRLKIWNAWLREYLPDESYLLEHCQIVGIDKASLIVIADNPHWVTRFRFFIPDLLIKLRQHDELKSIRAICCKAKPPHYRPAQPKRKPMMISDQTAEIVQETADKIKHGKLKAVLMRMAKRNLKD